MDVHAGSLAELQSAGKLLTKVGALPVVVFWDDGQAFAIEDRCPHLGFPLHQGTVESGLVTCHWHHARFDLVSGFGLAAVVGIPGLALYVAARELGVNTIVAAANLSEWWAAPVLVLASFVWENVMLTDPASTRYVVLGAMLVGVMVFRPAGLLGERRVEIV